MTPTRFDRMTFHLTTFGLMTFHLSWRIAQKMILELNDVAFSTFFQINFKNEKFGISWSGRWRVVLCTYWYIIPQLKHKGRRTAKIHNCEERSNPISRMWQTAFSDDVSSKNFGPSIGLVKILKILIPSEYRHLEEIDCSLAIVGWPAAAYKPWRFLVGANQYSVHCQSVFCSIWQHN